jgi:hypothetical protein
LRSVLKDSTLALATPSESPCTQTIVFGDVDEHNYQEAVGWTFGIPTILDFVDATIEVLFTSYGTEFSVIQGGDVLASSS